MLEIEIDGTKLEVPDGSTVMDAANKAGTYIPHFCYHKKLSIAANCRMCLVQVEKAPKPLPACATPVTNGMKVLTHSEQAVRAQKGVMEFLLINHPLDCPICDQGGECQLQDLAVGYGSSESRYKEEKRVVVNKNLGPLISTDMTRCIHCTRCVRFGQEIAGIMELGVANRGERSEIMAFVDRTVDSELSGNVIDLCPVGALTSKPFRYSARTWELSRRKSVSPHDGLGANLIVQVKHDEVKRVLPFENEEVNECWLSDKDRFSYEALSSDERLTRPMLKQGGEWREVDWQTALEYVAHGLKDIVAASGADAVGALVSPHATLEEMYLAGQLMRGLGSGNIDVRLRQSDFSLDAALTGAPWLGMTVSELAQAKNVLVVGSFLRKDHPLLCHRLRSAAGKGAQISSIDVALDDLLLPLAARLSVKPSELPAALTQVLRAALDIRGGSSHVDTAGVQVSEAARTMGESLCNGDAALLLGNFVQWHPQAGRLHVIGQELARVTGARFGYLGEAANSVGAYVAGALPFGRKAGLNATAMLEHGLKAYLLVNAEPEADFANPTLAVNALAAADMVVVMSPFKTGLDYADCILPIAPFSETSGTFVNTEGRIQSFNAVTKPRGETRPAWKVLRVLGNLLELGGFRFESSEAVRNDVLNGVSGFVPSIKLNNQISVAVAVPGTGAASQPGLERIADVPIYRADPLVRRAPSLARTRDSVAPAARMNPETLRKLGVAEGQDVRVSSPTGAVVLSAKADVSVPQDAVRVVSGFEQTAALGAMFAKLTVEAL